METPEYYKSGNIQPMDVINKGGFRIAFCIGNAIKYLMRAGHKHPKNATTEQIIELYNKDVQKAIHYIQMLVDSRIPYVVWEAKEEATSLLMKYFIALAPHQSIAIQSQQMKVCLACVSIAEGKKLTDIIEMLNNCLL